MLTNFFPCLAHLTVGIVAQLLVGANNQALTTAATGRYVPLVKVIGVDCPVAESA